MPNHVNTGDTMIGNYLERYRTWCAYQSYYHGLHEPVLIPSDHGIPCYTSLDLASINANDSDSVVFIDNMTESVHFYNKYFCHYRPDKHYVIFSEGWWDPDHYDIPLRYSQLPVHTWLFEMAENYFNPDRLSFYIDKKYHFSYPKPYHFVSTTGGHREERDRFVQQLLDRIEYSNFIFRYNGKDIGEPCHHDVVQFNDGDFDPYSLIPGLERYFHYVSQTVPIDLYNQGNFNIVAESNIDWPHQFHLTEKTIKVLVTGMPFVSLSSPRFLCNLHDLGFTTYHSLWDESYDLEFDYIKRIDKIISLCNSLASFDWQGHAQELEHIAQKNIVNFLSLHKHAITQWHRLEHCITELEKCQLI